jgi:hypothetical protein
MGSAANCSMSVCPAGLSGTSVLIICGAPFSLGATQENAMVAIKSNKQNFKNFI